MRENRGYRRWWWLLAAGLQLSGWSAEPEEPSADYARLMREAGLILLKEGNARFVAGKAERPNTDEERRRATAKEGQEPLAVVLACSDSRDPVELIFDRGVGDLFVVRVAGNVAGPSETATVEYGVGHLHTPLVVVMGHTRCGAVTAVAQGAELHGHLVQLAERIRPVTRALAAQGVSGADLVPRAIEANVWQVVADLFRSSGEVRERVESGRLEIVGALYDLETGVVRWLGKHPQQTALLAEFKVAGEGEASKAHGSGAGAGSGVTLMPAATFHPPLARRSTAGGH